jgi:membrane protein implicated in regulation of membrane protease activity
LSTDTDAHTVSEAEEARRSHSILSGVKEAILVWYALLAGIGAWTIHLVFFAAFVQYSCNENGTLWAMHLVTAVTLAMTAAAMWLCWRMLRKSDGDEGSDEEGGRAQFIGRLGLMIGALNFALIALEEIYLVVLNSRRCG